MAEGTEAKRTAEEPGTSKVAITPPTPVNASPGRTHAVAIDLKQAQAVDVEKTRHVSVDMSMGLEHLASVANAQSSTHVPDTGGDAADQIIAARATRHRNEAAVMSTTDPPWLDPGGAPEGPLPLRALSMGNQGQTVITPFVTPDQVTAGLHGTSALRAEASVAPADWVQRRAGMLDRFGAIETALLRIEPTITWLESAPAPPGIGHNQPDEPLLPIDTAQIRLGISAVKAMRIQLSQPQHSRSDVDELCGEALKQVLKGVKAALQWLAKRGEVFVDAFLKSAGDIAAKTLLSAAALAVVLNQLNVDLADVIAFAERCSSALAH